MIDAAPTTRPTVLVVDDTPENLSLMSALLKDDWFGTQLQFSLPLERGLA